MANHPNRGKPGPGSAPLPGDIVRAREKAGMTQRQAADVIYGTESSWRNWEQNLRPMHPGLFELFRIKTGQAEVRLVLSTSPERATYNPKG